MSVVKWDSIQIEQEWLSILREFFALLARQQYLALAQCVLQVIRLSSGKDYVLAVGAPARITLDIIRVIGSGQ